MFLKFCIHFCVNDCLRCMSYFRTVVRNRSTNNIEDCLFAIMLIHNIYRLSEHWKILFLRKPEIGEFYYTAIIFLCWISGISNHVLQFLKVVHINAVLGRLHIHHHNILRPFAWYYCHYDVNIINNYKTQKMANVLLLIVLVRYLKWATCCYYI